MTATPTRVRSPALIRTSESKDLQRMFLAD
jgi:hypothetical protein